MKNFRFDTDIEDHNPSKCSIVHISENINHKDDLLKTVGIKLKFPSYFG